MTSISNIIYCIIPEPMAGGTGRCARDEGRAGRSATAAAASTKAVCAVGRCIAGPVRGPSGNRLHGELWELAHLASSGDLAAGGFPCWKIAERVVGRVASPLAALTASIALSLSQRREVLGAVPGTKGGPVAAQRRRRELFVILIASKKQPI